MSRIRMSSRSQDFREEDDSESVPPPVSWKQFLLRDYHSETPDSSDGVWSLLLVLVWIAVFIVVTVVLINNRPNDPKVYTSNSAIPQKGYTCGCSLPLNLLEPEPTSDSNSTDVKSMNFNQCYTRSSLETITILQYPANTGLDAIVRQYATENDVVHYVESTGYVVSQEASELSVGDRTQLSTLYRNEQIGFAEEDVLFPLKGYVLQKDFMPFPRSYVRMAFRYDCTDCSSCGLEVIEGYLRNVTRSSNESWGSCYYWLRYDNSQCNPDRGSGSYTGKCVLYPTKTLPFSFAIKTFISAVNTTAGIQNIQSVSGSGQNLMNYASVQSNVVYLNKSEVSNGLLQYGFVESARGSSLWAWLVTNFPGFDGPCYNVPDVLDSGSVCNGSSVCNAFVIDDDPRSIQLKCKRWENDLDCESTVNKSILSLDNRHLNPDGVQIKAICHTPRYSCLSNSTSSESKVPAYRVSRFAPRNSTDPINAYLKSTILSDTWMRISGICTNTYTQVFRYNSTMFLQAECTNGTDLCKLTGKYYLVNDFSRQERQLGPRTFYNDTEGRDLFVCYKIREQPWNLWFLNYVNVLFSWLAVLLFLYLSGVYKLYRFLQVRYGHRQNRHRLVNWLIDEFHKITCCNLRVDSAMGRGRSSFRLQSINVPPRDPGYSESDEVWLTTPQSEEVMMPTYITRSDQQSTRYSG